MDYSKIRASIVVQDGQIIVNGMFDGEIRVMDENMQLMILRNITMDSLFSWEKSFQQKFRPNENTIYNLPKDE